MYLFRIGAFAGAGAVPNVYCSSRRRRGGSSKCTLLTTALLEDSERKRRLFRRLGQKHFFVNSEILGICNWQKQQVNCNKFEIATKCVN